MRFKRPSVMAVGVLSAVVMGSLAGCDQRTVEAPAPAPPSAETAAPAASDSRSFMAGIVQPATQVLWDFGYAEKMSDEDWSKVSKAATDLDAAMPTIAAGGFSAEEKARAASPEWQDWSKKTADFVVAAKAAADAKNQMGLATAGDSLVETCGGCHTAFDPMAQDPGAK
jgi:hypothetical protein